jgi:hypothetical protein
MSLDLSSCGVSNAQLRDHKTICHFILYSPDRIVFQLPTAIVASIVASSSVDDAGSFAAKL